MKFKEWITHQQDRKDKVGILARALVGKEKEVTVSKRRSDEHRYWVNIVTRLNKPRLNYVFNTAWQEYIDEKETLEEDEE